MANLFENARSERARSREIREQVLALKPAKPNPAKDLGEALAGSVEDASEHMRIQPEYHEDNAMLAHHATDPVHPNYNHGHYLLGVIRELQNRINDQRFGQYSPENEKLKNDPTPLLFRKPNIGRYQEAQEHIDNASKALEGHRDDNGNLIEGTGHWQRHDSGDGVGALASLIKSADHIQLAVNSINEAEKPQVVTAPDGEPKRVNGKLVMSKGKNPRTLGDADSFLNREDESATGLAFTPLASFKKLSLGKRLSTVVNSYRMVVAKHNPKSEGVVKQLSRNYKLGVEPPVDAVEDLTDDEFSRSAAEADLRAKGRLAEQKAKTRTERKGVPTTLPLDHPTRLAMEAQKQQAEEAGDGPSRYQTDIQREAEVAAYAEQRGAISKKASRLMELQSAAATAKGAGKRLGSPTALENRAYSRAARIAPPIQAPIVMNFDAPSESVSPLSKDTVAKNLERDAPLAAMQVEAPVVKKRAAKSKPAVTDTPTPEIAQAETDRKDILEDLSTETEDDRATRYSKKDVAAMPPVTLADHFGLAMNKR